MIRDANRIPFSNRVMPKTLGTFALAIAIMAFFGYVVGRDMALRDNAREAAAQTAK